MTDDDDVDLFGNPIPKRQTEKGANAAIDALFLKWWSHYPRKVAIGKARMAFHKAHKTGKFGMLDIPDMVATLKWQTTEVWIGKHEKYIPHATTYINQERWKDERPKRAGESFGRISDDDLPF
jgi:hypothetical protein